MSVKKRKKPDPIAAMDRKIAKIVRSVELIEQRTDDMQESMYHIIDQLNMDHVIREPLSIDKLNQMCARVGDLWYRIIKRGGKGPTDLMDLMERVEAALITIHKPVCPLCGNSGVVVDMAVASYSSKPCPNGCQQTNPADPAE